MDKIQKDIEDIMYELRTLRSLVLFSFFLNGLVYIMAYFLLFYSK